MARRRSSRKYYIMKDGRSSLIFSGRSPRQAALKAATRGIKEIVLRERGRRNKDGTYTLHKFKGSVRVVDAPSDKPAWLPDKIKKPKVLKDGTERVAKIR